jgi:hypothetical protein
MMAFERVGAVMAIVGATAVGKATKPGCDAAQTAPESRQGGAGRADQASAIPQRREGSGASAGPATGYCDRSKHAHRRSHAQSRVYRR